VLESLLDGEFGKDVEEAVSSYRTRCSKRFTRSRAFRSPEELAALPPPPPVSHPLDAQPPAHVRQMHPHGLNNGVADDVAAPFGKGTGGGDLAKDGTHLKPVYVFHVFLFPS
jgi:hypothetical protein